MKYIVLFCLVLLALGFRHSHKSQYDLGYEAGLKAADVDEFCPPRYEAWCINEGCGDPETFERCNTACGC